MNARRSSGQQPFPARGERSEADRSARDRDGSWRLPSGQSLAEFALRSGWIASRLLGPGAFPSVKAQSEKG